MGRVLGSLEAFDYVLGVCIVVPTKIYDALDLLILAQNLTYSVLKLRFPSIYFHMHENTRIRLHDLFGRMVPVIVAPV